MLRRQLTPKQALAAIHAGRTVRVEVGTASEDPICLQYLDRTYEFDHEPMIFTESIGGWSEGAKEAICEPDSPFYVEHEAERAPLSRTITDEEPPRREWRRPVSYGGSA